MGQATGIGADRSCRPRAILFDPLVDFVQDVELAIGALMVLLYVVEDEASGCLWENLLPLIQPFVDLVMEMFDGSDGLFVSESAVYSSIPEMSEAVLNILEEFHCTLA